MGSPPSTTTTGTGVVTALGVNTNAAGGMGLVNGSIVAGHCLQWSSTGVQDAGGTCGIGGGGGGYSGGGAGSNSSNPSGSVGGGGGSYNSGINPINVSGINSGDGKVWITRICNAGPNPVNTTPVSQQTLCSGNAATLSVSGTGTVNWYSTGSSNTSLGTGTSITISTLTPGNYTFYAASTNTCTEGPRVPVTLTVFVSPT